MSDQEVLSVADLEAPVREYRIVADRVEDGRMISQTVIGEGRAERLLERWENLETLCNTRGFRGRTLDDCTRHLRHDWSPRETEHADSDVPGWRTR